MKDTSAGRTSAGRAAASGTDQTASSSDAAAGSQSVSQSGGSKTCFKESMFSSSDTDDCDADKLVIDLDAAGGSADTVSTADIKSTPISGTVTTPSSSSTRSESGKVRNSENSGSKSSSHRQQSSSSNKSGSDGIPLPSDKGLKMKIKCSQVGGAGGPARHEISQFHTHVNSSVPLAATSSSSSSSSSSGSKASGSERAADKDKDAVVKVDRVASSGSHRKDHRTNVKERTSNKDRPVSDSGQQQQHVPTSSGNATVQQLSNSTSAQPSTAIASLSTAAKDSVNDNAVKTQPESDRDAQWNHAAGSASHKDPYEFSVKLEESVVGRPSKKIKLDKLDAACSPIPLMVPGCPTTDSSTPTPETRDVSVDACHVGVLTDPDCLGPCEPGTTVTLEGIVWNETENGLLVVNVTWRGKTYVGTLMDATKHHWAPPRFATESPTSDLDGRTPKGRGKRGRTCTSAARAEINGSDRKLRSNRCAAPATVKSSVSSAGSSSPVRTEASQLGAPAAKRPRGSESQTGNGGNSSDVSRAASKAGRSESRMSVTADTESNGAEGVLIECPAPNCSKKYRHISGLRYHQSRSHPSMNFDDDTDDMDAGFGSKLKVKSDNDGPDAESASDVDKNEAADGIQNCALQGSDSSSKNDKKSKADRNKSKSTAKQASAEMPGSPSVGPIKSSVDDSTISDKQKSRKKDRERVKDSVVAENQSCESENICEDTINAQYSLSSSIKVSDAPPSESQNYDAEVAARATSDSGSSVDEVMKRGGESVSVIRTGAEMNLPVPNGDVNTNACESVMDTDVANTADCRSSAISPGSTLPSRRPKTTPTKYGSEFDNPHSPAYSDISDANDSAPMLEKEATPSASVDDEDLAVNGSSVVERCPVSQHLVENFTGPFGGSTLSLYGQPPCLTPAVVPPPALDASWQQASGVKMEKSEPLNQDDRSGHPRSSALRPPLTPRLAGDPGRNPGPDLSDLTERNLGSLQRSTSRSQGDAPSPQPQQSAPPVLPPNIFMQYQYGAGPGGYPLELLQNPEYRAQWEMMMRRPAADLPPDFKGFPGPTKTPDIDRKNKTDGQLPAGSLPTPPSLIPDRGVMPFDEQESRLIKQKTSERRGDDPQRSGYPHHHHQQQQYSVGGERQRRHEESGNNKPSAVVAPQARDRVPTSSGSTKVRPEDQPRGSSSSHDQNRSSHKPVSSKSTPTSAHQDTTSRQSDRSGREEKSSSSGVNRSGNSGAPYKKEDTNMSLSSMSGVPLPLSSTYAPYYPYLPPQLDPAFYGGLNPVIGYTGPTAPSFLHPAQVGYLTPSVGTDVASMMSPAGGPHLSPSDGKPRDVPSRSFYPGGDGAAGAPSTVHKIHELKEVAKGGGGSSADGSQSAGGAPTGSGLRDVIRPESRGGAGAVGLPKDLDRGGNASPPTQRHVHTHHHMHMLGPTIAPLFGGVFPGDPSIMSPSQSGSASSSLQRPFIGK